MSQFNSDSRVNDRHRIVVTGLGMASPLGRTLDDYWRRLSQPINSQLTHGERPAAGRHDAADDAGQLVDVDDLPAGVRKRLRKSLKLMDRQTELGVLAGQRALSSSGLLDSFDPDRVGVCFGADNPPLMPQEFGRAVAACADENGELDMARWGAQGIPEMAPLWLLKCLPNMPACHLAILNDLCGPNNTLTTRDVAFGMALTEACRTIRSGDADAVLVGATGSTLSPLGRLHAIVEHEAIHDRRTDQLSKKDDESYLVPSEGAGAFVLEDLQFARRRGASIYGEILSSASASCVGDDGATACGTALANAMRETLRRADLSATSIGHIHAAGDRSQTMRKAQSQAIADVFGSAAPQIPVLRTIPGLTHAGAGAGAMQFAASLLVINHRWLFGADAEDDASSCACQQHAGECFLSLSLLPRGLSHCVAVGAVQQGATIPPSTNSGGDQ